MLPDGVLDLARIGEPTGHVFREHQLAVQVDVEDAAAPLDQLGPDAELPLDLVRQTGGTRTVVSDDAVFDRDRWHLAQRKACQERGRVYRTAPWAPARGHP